MLHFKEGIGWKACYDDERNLYTAKTSWRGDFHLYEIDAEIYNQLGEPGVYADELIHSGRHLYYSQDNPIGPPTDMIRRKLRHALLLGRHSEKRKCHVFGTDRHCRRSLGER